MTRLSKEQLNELKKKYNVDRIWSFSRVNAAQSCFWDYWARYVKHLDIDGSSIYTEWGTNSHDLVTGILQAVSEVLNASEHYNGRKDDVNE